MTGRAGHDRGNIEPLAVPVEVGQGVAGHEYITDYLFFWRLRCIHAAYLGVRFQDRQPSERDDGTLLPSAAFGWQGTRKPDTYLSVCTRYPEKNGPVRYLFGMIHGIRTGYERDRYTGDGSRTLR